MKQLFIHLRFSLLRIIFYGYEGYQKGEIHPIRFIAFSFIIDMDYDYLISFFGNLIFYHNFDI